MPPTPGHVLPPKKYKLKTMLLFFDFLAIVVYVYILMIADIIYEVSEGTFSFASNRMFAFYCVFAITIGLVVDDTIHFLHAFNRDLERGADVRTATRQTLLTTGRAMFVTSLTLAAGFLAYTQATLQNLVNFGVLIAAVIGFFLGRLFRR